MIKIFTPSFADEADTNAQNLSVKEIVARLDPDRFRVTMFVEGKADPRIESRVNIRLLKWKARGNTLRTLARIVIDRPDVYFFPREGPLDSAFLKLRRALRFNCALVTYIVSGGLESLGYAPPRMENIREATIVLANNKHLAALLKDKFNVRADVIYDGIDRRYFFPPKEPRSPDKKVTVLYAGSMRPYKRVPMVIREAHKWPEVNFRIAGTGEEEQACKSLAADLKCANVTFLGHLPSQVLGDEMRLADIFLFPSSIEGHPQVLGQAAACGLPIVAMNFYHPDFVTNGSTGFLVGDDDSLSEKLSLLIRQGEARTAMGQAGISHVQQFDWDWVTSRWQDVFEDALEKCKPSHH